MIKMQAKLTQCTIFLVSDDLYLSTFAEMNLALGIFIVCDSATSFLGFQINHKRVIQSLDVVSFNNP